MININQTISDVTGNTLLTKDRLLAIAQLAQSVKSIAGEWAEVGVWRGGAAWLIRGILDSDTGYLFDTFEGIPMKDEIDHHQVGDFAQEGLHETVKGFFKGFPLVKIKKGIFPATAKGLVGPFKFVHIDGDQFKTTCDAIDFFLPKMFKGGVMVFDDADDLSGVVKAIDLKIGWEKMGSLAKNQAHYVVK